MFSFTLIFFFCCLLVFKVQILIDAVSSTLSDYFTLLYEMNVTILSFGMMASLLGGLGVRCVQPPMSLQVRAF